VVQTGAGRSWHWTNSTSGPDPTVAGSGGAQTYIPFDWVIEYECATRRKVYLVVGDAFYEGITGGNSSLSSTALWRNAVNLWAAKHNALVVNVSLAGITLAYFGGSTPSLISRQDVSGITDWAGIIIPCGSNDFAVSRTLAQMQADVLATLANVQTMMSIPTDTPVYMGTLLARGATGDAVRLTYNEWLSSLPTFIGDSGGDVIDFDGALRGTTAQNLVDQYNSDSIHPSWLGNIAIRDKLAAVLP
jgi:lysophospholipase L1-like esterase